MKIVIEVIPHQAQRYDTCGDWEWTGENLTIRVSDLGNDVFNFLVATHELHEAMLCRFRGITTKMVDAWDLNWTPREPTSGPSVDEAGNDPRAPYHREHRFGLVIEELVGHELGIDKAAYDAAFDALPTWTGPIV